MNYITLSHTLKADSPVHVALRKPKIIQNSYISRGDGYNSFIITTENHSGTHVDAPGHFLDGAKIISEYLPDELIFNSPLILDIHKDINELIEIQDVNEKSLNGVDCLFFRTGFEVFRDEHPNKYLTQNPGVSPEVIYWVRKNYPEIRCLGIDSVSISSYKHPGHGKEAHLNAFKDDRELGEPLLLIEDMKLNNIKNEDLEWVMVVPWQIEGIDSAPCTIVAK